MVDTFNEIRKLVEDKEKLESQMNVVVTEADEKVKNLMFNLDVVRNENNSLMVMLDDMKQMVKARDDEINRLKNVNPGDERTMMRSVEQQTEVEVTLLAVNMEQMDRIKQNYEVIADTTLRTNLELTRKINECEEYKAYIIKLENEVVTLKKRNDGLQDNIITKLDTGKAMAATIDTLNKRIKEIEGAISGGAVGGRFGGVVGDERGGAVDGGNGKRMEGVSDGFGRSESVPTRRRRSRRKSKLRSRSKSAANVKKDSGEKMDVDEGIASLKRQSNLASTVSWAASVDEEERLRSSRAERDRQLQSSDASRQWGVGNGSGLGQGANRDQSPRAPIVRSLKEVETMKDMMPVVIMNKMKDADLRCLEESSGDVRSSLLTKMLKKNLNMGSGGR